MRSSRGRGVLALLAVATLLGACSGAGTQASPGTGNVTLRALFMKQAAYSEADVKAMTDSFTAANPNIKVTTDFVGYDALHDKIITDQIGGGGTYDLFLMDTPWPAEFVKAGIVTDITGKIPADVKSGVFDSAWTAATYQGKIYGVPWINDTKFFFYNKKMFADAGITSAPKTWDDVVADAQAIKAKGIVQYPIVWSWKQAEAVICDWTELAGAMGGANFIDAQGNATFNTGGGLAALEFMKKTIDLGLTNPASLGLLEDDVNKTMSAGQAAMALNWTYGYAVMNDPQNSTVAGQIAVTSAPGQGSTTTAGVNGGMSIAVSKTSKNPDAALQYALWVASEKSQEMDTANAFPMWKASFDKPDVTKANPEYFAAAKNEFENLVARPVVPYYTKLSNALQVAIQTALQGKQTPQQALDGVAAQLPDLQK